MAVIVPNERVKKLIKNKNKNKKKTYKKETKKNCGCGKNGRSE